MYLFNEGGDPFVPITHFWGADGGTNNSTFLSGTFPILGIPTDWSFSCENAMQKAAKYFVGPTMPHYSFNDYHFEEEDQLAFGNHYIKVYDLLEFYETGYCKVYGSSLNYIGWFHLIETQKLIVFYEIIGRICHLMMDMGVPAHTHEDQHAPEPHCSDGDQYEGNLDEDFGFMINPENWYWESLNTYLTKGGLLDISSETDPLLYLIYITNQIGDFFASDDVDGNSNLWDDPSVLNANSFLQSKFTELESQGYTEEHPIRNHHEMQLWSECPAIRNNVFPLAMRTVATFLEYIAQEINLTANFLPAPFCFVQGSVSLNGGGGDIEEVSILFEPQDLGQIIELNPDSEGNFLDAFGENRYGTYDVTYELFSSDGNYYPYTDYDVEIDQGTLTLPNVDLIPIPEMTSTIIVNQEGTGDFADILFAVLAVEQNATIYVGPGTYSGEYNKNISWNGNEKNITIWGSNNAVIDCENDGRAFTINNGTEDDIIKGFTIINTNSNYSAGGAIKIVNGCPQIIENTFNNCSSGDYPGYYQADGGAIVVTNANGTQIINNTFDENSAFSGGAIYVHSSSNISILNNIFTNNTSGHIYDSSDGSTGIAGAVHIDYDSDAIISNNFFQENESNNGSAALAFLNSTGVINENEFDSNKFGFCDTNCEYESNTLGIYYNSSCEIYDNTFSNNYSDVGVRSVIADYGSTTIYNNSFINNLDCENILFYSNPINEELTNCIFSGNESYSISWGDVTLNYCNTYQSGNLGSGVIEGTGCLLNTNPQLDTQTYQPLWNSTTKSPCIDAGNPNLTDPDGTPADIGAVRAITHKYDIVDLPSPDEDNGWKWLSLPALDNVYSTTGYDPDVAEYLLADIMQLPVPAILDVVESQNYTIAWNGIAWEHDYEQFLRTEGFKFHMNDDYTLDVPGFKEPDNTTIVLEGNLAPNWVGYWLEETQSVEDAFSEYWNVTNITSITAQHWSAVRFFGNWLAKVEHGYSPTLSYGDMVIIECNTAINDFGWDNSTPEDPAVTFSEPENFTYEEQASYLPLYIEIDPEDPPLEIGAIVDGECVGATVVTDTINQISAYVSGVDPGDIELELYYGDRAEPRTLSSYKCVSVQEPDNIKGKISTKSMDSAYFITLRDDSGMIQEVYDLSASNYPNPFNPTTTIVYSLPDDGRVNLEVYNIKGQLVKTLVKGEQLAGSYETVWNGKDNNDKSVSSGIYFYRLSTKDDTIMKKMLMLK
ncbi:MAG: T9SS type A sorting domain-containing protein [Candidatus Cloacimonetes bacterium]|nr:T9SS type A sorting domain-containing protein [Candidatus Cloacimonadota bacterium]